MRSLSIPDLNVWLPLVVDPHVHRECALEWWRNEPEGIAFSRFTQIGLLRLLTTAAVMNGRPLTMSQAWRVYDRLRADGRVSLLSEPEAIEPVFRRQASAGHVSPKQWADAYLLAFTQRVGGRLVTFDQALAARCPGCLLLGAGNAGRRNTVSPVITLNTSR